MSREFGLKFAATPDGFAAVKAMYTDYQDIAMESTYYDTVDRKILNMGAMLRKRIEDGLAFCTLKTPGDMDTRCELEVQTDSVFVAIPELCKIGAPEWLLQFNRNNLVAASGARYRRLAKMIDTDDGSVELALDEGVFLQGGKEIPFCEIELELKEGERRSVWAIAEIIQSVPGVKRQSENKYQRASKYSEAEKQL